MHGHDADLAARALQFALHLDVGGLQLGQAGLQIDGAPVFGGQHLVQGLVDGFFRLAAQTGQDAGAAGSAGVVHPVQGLGEEGEGIAAARTDGGLQRIAGAGPFGAFVRPVAQVAPQLAGLAVLAPGQGIEAVLVHVAQGAAQHLGQGQIVVGEERKTGQRDQVVEHDVAGQFQPVGAGHGHALGFQRPDDLLERRVAASDQDDIVAVSGGTQVPRAAVEDGDAAFHLAADFASHVAGQAFPGAAGAFLIDGIVPGVGLGRGFVEEQGPQVDGAVLADPRGDMAGDVALGSGQGAGAVGIGEDGVDEGQHLFGRAVGGVQLRPGEGLAGAFGQGQEGAAFLTQPFGPGALEGIDRLFLVADGEDGATGFFAGIELAGQGADDGPLFGGGVLGLVDQDVIDPAVQLVQHPGGGAAFGQQGGGAGDQIGEVQRPALSLGGLVEGGVGAGQCQDLDRIVGDLGLAQGLARDQEFGLKVQQPADRALRRRLGAHALTRFARLGAEDPGQGREPGVGRGGDAHGVGDLLVIGRAGLHGLGHAVPLAGIDEGDEIALQILRTAVALGAGQGPRIGRGSGLGAVDIIQQVGAFSLDHRQQGLEPLPVQLDGEMAVGLADGTVGIGDGGAGQVFARGMAQRGRGLVFQNGEAGRDPGFQREAPQQLFAEGVDGLDLQPAGRLQRAGEQLAGAR